jgi:DNA repair protein RadA/Sms
MDATAHGGVIDSIQTVYSEQLTSAPGSVAQVRECAAHLTRTAKYSGTCMVLVGHVTKEGALAGPRVLEHMVDTVLYFEGDTHSSFRLVRAIKNRFGAVNEIGVFAMTEKRPEGREQPQRHLFEPARRARARQLRDGDAGGHTPAAGGNPGAGGQRRPQPPAPERGPGPRPPGHAAGRAAPPRRRGLHGPGRVCERRGRRAHQRAGGRPGRDAGHHVSLRGKALPKGFIAFGEVGLAGEVRPAPRGQERLKEAAKLGFSVAVVPKANAPKKGSKDIEGLTIHAVERVDEAMEIVRGLG